MTTITITLGDDQAQELGVAMARHLSDLEYWSAHKRSAAERAEYATRAAVMAAAVEAVGL